MDRNQFMAFVAFACIAFAWSPCVSARLAPGDSQIELIDAVATPVLEGGDASGRRLLALPDPSRTLNSAANCAGWYEPRVFMEAQGWFTL
jgi:hypothetical protein